MNLTPIKVRGKRKQPTASSDAGKSPATTDRHAHNNSNKKKATKPRADDDDNANNDDNARPKKRQPMTLAQLPQEILETIFVASRNLSLPLANRALHRLLSSTSVKYALVGAAFDTTWDAWYGINIADVHSYDGWLSDRVAMPGDPGFQTAVLARPWATLPVILDAFDVWIRQRRAPADARPYFTIPDVLRERSLPAPIPGAGSLPAPAPDAGSLWDRAYGSGDAASSGQRKPHMSMREKLAFDLHHFDDYLAGGAGVSYCEPGPFDAAFYRVLMGMHIEVHPGTAIPDDLLSGPYESDDGGLEVGEEKSQRLFWLVRGGACLQEDQTWEVTWEGISAILNLISSSSEAPVDQQRFRLACRLFQLFDILGVLDRQWPYFICERAADHFASLISRTPEESAFQRRLRHPSKVDIRAPLAYEMLGRRWRLPVPAWRINRLNVRVTQRRIMWSRLMPNSRDFLFLKANR